MPVKRFVFCLLIICFAGLPVSFCGSESAEISSFSAEYLQKIYFWLKLQQSQTTGLVESFSETGDVELSAQASTYDQAVAGICFLLMGDYESADKILLFFDNRWNDRGYINFYNTITGDFGIETRIHTGPNLWIALLALQYDKFTNTERYSPLARKIVRWVGDTMPHKDGGIAMSYLNDTVPWREVYSTENNIDYYALTKILEENADSEIEKAFFHKEKRGVADWLKNVVFDQQTGVVYRGFNDNGLDRTLALDTISWMITALSPEFTNENFGIAPDFLVEFAEKEFMIKDKGIEGFDFTDKTNTEKTGRNRVIWLEGTGQMVNTYMALHEYNIEKFKELKDTYPKAAAKMAEKADYYVYNATFFLGEMDKLKVEEKKYLIDPSVTQTLEVLDFLCSYHSQKANKGNLFSKGRAEHYAKLMDNLAKKISEAETVETAGIPYSSRPYIYTFADGWLTPHEKSTNTDPTAASATSWRIICAYINPFKPLGRFGRTKLPKIKTIDIPSADFDFDIMSLPPALNSSGLLKGAFDNLNNGNILLAEEYSLIVADKYKAEAVKQQEEKLKNEKDLIYWEEGDYKSKAKIFKYDKLNDVGTALFILGKIYFDQRKYKESLLCFKTLVEKFYLAQTWDPNGWFWPPASAAQTEYLDIYPELK
ncbi:hypothetical protein M0R36_07475 [bacterium]|jgi:hypothetical protein|nr:hypothetical protein [bacterium]